MPKKQKQPQTAANEAQTSASDIYNMSLRYLRTEIEKVISGKAAKTKHDPAYRVATLTRMVSQVEAERRKAHAAENKHLEKITRPLVIAWLRQADPEERESIAREIAAMRKEGSILA